MSVKNTPEQCHYHILSRYLQCIINCPDPIKCDWNYIERGLDSGSFYVYVPKRVFNTKLKSIVMAEVSSVWHLYWVWSDVACVGPVTIANSDVRL